MYFKAYWFWEGIQPSVFLIRFISASDAHQNERMST